jgi:hypothetical protein
MSKNRRFVGALVVFSAFAIAAASTATAAPVQGRGQAKKADKKAEKVEKKIDKIEKKADKADDKRDKKDDVNVVAVDRDGHVRVFREFRGSLPPGLAKREALPPGLRNQLRERGALPPGLQNRLIPVPVPWVARLPPVPAHHTRYFAGDDFIVVDTRTNRIVAIVRDVWR